jgi:ketosteroid isomerase-like protein
MDRPSAEHPNAVQAREVFAALAGGDLAPAFDLMTDDYVLHNDIGAGPWRELHGKAEVLNFWTRWMELFDNTFHQEVLDVLGYDDRIVMIMHETGEARGTPFDNRAVYLHEIRDGKWASLRTIDLDPDNCRQFWATVPAPELAAPPS